MRVCACVMDPMLCIFLRQCPVVSEVAAGSFKEKSPPEICAKGYVVRTLEAALWAFYHTDSFKDGCLKVGELRKGWQTGLVVLLATMRLTTPTCSHLPSYQSPSPPGTLGIGCRSLASPASNIYILFISCGGRETLISLISERLSGSWTRQWQRAVISFVSTRCEKNNSC